MDGLQPDVGQDVLWVIREVRSGEILLTRALLSSTHDDLATLLREVKEGRTVPVQGRVSDGQQTIWEAMALVCPQVPHQRCHSHSLREAAKRISYGFAICVATALWLLWLSSMGRVALLVAHWYQRRIDMRNRS